MIVLKTESGLCLPKAFFREFIPEDQDGSSSKGGAVCTRDCADEEGKDEPLGGLAAEEVHGK